MPCKRLSVWDLEFIVLLDKIKLPTIYLNGNTLDRVENHKYCGIIINKTLYDDI